MRTDFCVCCGDTYDLQDHHIEARLYGGSDESINLITVCYKCHARIHGRFSAVNHREMTLRGYDKKRAADLVVIATHYHTHWLDSGGCEFLGDIPLDIIPEYYEFIRCSKVKVRTSINAIALRDYDSSCTFSDSIFTTVTKRLLNILDNKDFNYYAWWLFYWQEGSCYKECPILSTIKGGN